MSIISNMKKQKRNAAQFAFLSGNSFDDILCEGYTPLDHNPEVLAACRAISNLISSMTIYLLANTENGDKRIVNRLSRKVDIEPWTLSTRKNWMETIVMNMLLYGNGNAVVRPTFDRDFEIKELEPISANRVSFYGSDNYYEIAIDGVRHSPQDFLHFVYNPDKYYPWKGAGVTVALKDVAKSLKQAATTKKAFMSSKFKPSIIVKVDGITEEFASKEGRKKLLDTYFEATNAGEPWLIPSEQFGVEQVKPLSLNDLAISDTVKLDKQTVASILGVPSFVLGVGDFKKDEWNHFISSTIHGIAESIEQELTKKLLVSEKMYWHFNIASLYAYDIQTTANIYTALHDRGVVTGNEVRDKVGLEHREGLDTLVVLENYIPLDKIQDQAKLNGGSNEQ